MGDSLVFEIIVALVVSAAIFYVGFKIAEAVIYGDLEDAEQEALDMVTNEP